MNKASNKRKTLSVFGAAVLGCACIGVLLRTLSLFFFYDADVGYFSRGAALPVVFNMLIAVATVGCAVLCFIPRSPLTPDNCGDSGVSRMLYAFPCLASAYALIAQISAIGSYSDIGLAIPRIELLILVFNALAIVYFAVSIFGNKIHAGFSVVFGAFAILWLMLMLVNLYFDMYIQINSPNKTMMAFALASAMLFISSELRLGLEVKKPQTQLFTTAFAVICLSTSSIPTLIAHFAGAFGNSYRATVSDILCLTLLFPAVARFVKLCFAKEADTCNTVEAVQEGSDTK